MRHYIKPAHTHMMFTTDLVGGLLRKSAALSCMRSHQAVALAPVRTRRFVVTV